MSLKLKILGMALLACAATSAFAVMNASATVSGHFEHEGATNNAVIKAEEGAITPSHQLKFYRLEPNSHLTANSKPIECEKATYEGTVTAKTVTSIQMTPTYTNCKTEGSATPGEVVVHTNGCSYTFFSHGALQHGTVVIDCPSGKTIEITHPNCTIKIPAQGPTATMTEGITYHNVVEGKNSLTGTVTVNTITGHFEGGLCVFLGTNHKFEMKGNVTIKGFEHSGAQIGIKHT